MRLASNRILHTLPLLLPLAGCIITTGNGDPSGATSTATADTSSGDTSSGDTSSGDTSSASTSDTPTTTSPTTTDASSGDSTGTTPSGEIPPELVGWTWTWTTSSGGESLVFTAEGAYTSDVFLDAHIGDSCGTEYFTHYDGAALFSGSALTLSPAMSERTKVDSCTDEVVSKEVFEGEEKTYEWRLVTDDGCQPALTLTDSENFEKRYCGEAS